MERKGVTELDIVIENEMGNAHYLHKMETDTSKGFHCMSLSEMERLRIEEEEGMYYKSTIKGNGIFESRVLL